MTDNTAPNRVLLSPEQILTANDVKIEWVPTPEWGSADSGVYVRSLQADELDAYQGSMLIRTPGKKKPQTTMANMRAKLAVRAICDEKGVRLFTDDQADALTKKNAAGMSRVFEAASRLSGLGEDAISEMEENLKKD